MKKTSLLLIIAAGLFPVLFSACSSPGSASRTGATSAATHTPADWDHTADGFYKPTRSPGWNARND